MEAEVSTTTIVRLGVGPICGVTRYGGREGWRLSTRFCAALRTLAAFTDRPTRARKNHAR